MNCIIENPRNHEVEAAQPTSDMDFQSFPTAVLHFLIMTLLP
jgi:hypothetical protein